MNSNLRPNLRALRLQLVEEDRNLRNAKDNFAVAKASCETTAINEGKAGGKNAEERDRNMAMALAADDSYQHALTMLRDAEYSRDRAEALLEAAKDERRAAEWQIRCKLADGLFSQGIQSDHQDYADDGAFDDTGDEYQTRAAVAAYDDDLPW